MHSLKYLRSTTLNCTDIEIRKFEIVAMTQFLSLKQEVWTTQYIKTQRKVPIITLLEF